MARGFYPLEDNPEYQEEVERLLNTDPVRAEDSFFGSLLLWILNNIKAAWQKAVVVDTALQELRHSLGEDAPPLENSGVPTQETEGSIGQTYTDTETGEVYTCTGITEDGRYIWVLGTVGTLDQIREAVGENAAEIAATREALHGAKAEMEAHIANRENPHGITPAQIGAARTATYQATFPAAGWSGAAPYQQTVAVPGITVLDNPIAGLLFQDGNDAYNTQVLEEWGYISRITTSEGAVTGVCFEDRPTVDIRVQLKVVR